MAPASSAADSQQLEAADVDEEEIITSGGAIGTYRPVLIEPSAMIPEIFTRPPLVRDVLQTDTSEVQDDTVQLCLPFMDGDGQDGLGNYNEFGVPRLDRPRHVKFLRASLESLPGSFVGYDASRPWLLYWCLNGLTLLGEDVTSYHQRLVDTARSMQNVTGGFGGGHGQASHLATTYAVVLSLAIIGGQDCYDVIDRRGLWRWLCALKQPNGGFQMSIGAEVDVRYVTAASRRAQLRLLTPAYTFLAPAPDLHLLAHACSCLLSPSPGFDQTRTLTIQGSILCGCSHFDSKYPPWLEPRFAGLDARQSYALHRTGRICPEVCV